MCWKLETSPAFGHGAWIPYRRRNKYKSSPYGLTVHRVGFVGFACCPMAAKLRRGILRYSDMPGLVQDLPNACSLLCVRRVD